MKLKYSSLLILSLVMSWTAFGQILRTFTPRYTNPSVRGNIVFVSNNIMTSTGVSTTEVPPGGTAVNNNNPGAYLDIDATPPTSYIPFGSNWKYRVTNTRPVNWHQTGFNDTGWPNGNAELGFGDGDETTTIGFGGNPSNVYVTTYFRKAVNIANPGSHSNFTFTVKRDDGVAIYVNNVEVYRNNLPAGVLLQGTLASASASNDGDDLQIVTLPTSTFAAGNNVIAVEIHQNDIASTDLSFDLQLVGNPNTLTSFLPFGSNWKYLDNNTSPAGWNTTGFNDAAWAAGNAQLGYGDGDEATVVGYGGVASNKYITTYFRKVINIANPLTYSYFIANLVRDDGAVIYVNGVEVARSNLPTGVITQATLATSAASGAEENSPFSFIIPSSAFVNGANTIAVEIHQNDIASTDLGFDLEIVGSTDPTFSSTSADLNLPSCTNILWAGLYWGATQGTSGSNTAWILGETSVKIRVPGSALFTNLISTQTDYHNNTLVPGLPHTGYRCFTDITSLLNPTSPNGTYTVGNVVGPVGINNVAAGWTIVIAYGDPATVVRNLTVFDGSAIMNGGDPSLNIPITGFLTPPSGPVSCELGAVVFDGDRVQTDEFSFKQNSNPLLGTYTNLTPNATSNLNDMWNSTISYKGAVVTTRNPAHQNTLGYDADIVNVPNASNVVLGNSQNSASIRFSSPSENYMLQVATTSISQYTPSFNLVKSSVDINGGILAPGDQVRYQVSYVNGGNDASTSTNILDNIPVGTTYKPGSLIISGVPKTDAVGDDEAEYDFVNNRVVFRLGVGANGTTGGEVNPAGSGTVSFEVYTASSCLVFGCNTLITNRARISYGGKLSLINLADSSGVNVSGCTIPGPVGNTMAGSCAPLGDTILVNTCPSLSVMLPTVRYAGYRFFSAMPFTAANEYNPTVPITFTRTIYAYYDGPTTCDDTRMIHVYIIACPDIDDDNDGIPDYVEINIPLALNDHDLDFVPNWNDVNYPGYVDYNSDGFNDNFDPSADSDNDGTFNFYDPNFAGYVDTNGDGVNDNMDKDMDGIPNHLDLDSDNDGIPDVVESFGVDANGDGRIDNYTDTDNDGFSQNVDAAVGGVVGSGTGLGALDTDGDGIGNYLDKDSDNDGIPDAIEVYGADANNDGRLDAYSDTDGDGYSDLFDGDVGNDNVSENSVATLLRTSSDGNNDGRADSFPYNNMDNDSKPNPYDLDSDGDGISDVREAQFTDGNSDGRIDGALNIDGWNTVVAAQGSLSLPNTDAVGRINVYDIDADNDGIPDNVEGLATLAYALPSGIDTDNDGIDNSYDNFAGFGGNGITPFDKDGDLTPDYLDLDTDSDGIIDRIEGNDLNFNYLPDDNVTLTGVDTDGDGLDDRFDSDNTSAQVTSAYMGNGGTFTGDPSPGSITTVQTTSIGDLLGCLNERDWRCMFYTLNCDIINFTAGLQGQTVKLDWKAICRQEVDRFFIQRSTDRVNFQDIQDIPGRPVLNEFEAYSTTDNITGIGTDVIYYRLKTVLKNGRTSLGSIIAMRLQIKDKFTLQIAPNPVRDQAVLHIYNDRTTMGTFRIIDVNGKILYTSRERVSAGNTSITLSQMNMLPNGMYYLQVVVGETVLIEKISIVR